MSKPSRPKDRKKIYEIFEERGGGIRIESTVDKLMRQENEQLVREAERLNLETIVAERKQRLNAAQKGVSLNPSGSKDREELAKALLTNPQVQKEWLAMDDASRATLLASANTLTQQGQNTGALATYLPFMMTQMRQNPNTSVKEMVDLINVVRPAKGDENKNVVEAIRLGFEMASKNQPQGTNESIFKETMSFLKPLYDTLSAKDKEIYNQQFGWLQSQIVSPTQQIRDVKDVAEMMGYKTGGDSIEATKMRIDHERWMAEETWKHEAWRDEQQLKKDSEDKRWQAITDIGTKWMDKVAPIIDDGVSAAQKKLRGAAPDQPQSTQSPAQAISFPCRECGTVISVKGDPESVTCPKCGQIHTKQPLT